jgi:hypothetical protein
MAVTVANSKHYDKMAKKVESDSHIAKGGNNGDEVQAAAMPRGMTSGRNGGKADRNMTPSPTIKAEKYGR